MSSNKGTDLFIKNTSLLIEKYPAFKADILDKYSPSAVLQPSEAADGCPTARIQNIWIHSSRSPSKEAMKLVSSGIKIDRGVCLIFGFGLGYHIEALMTKFPDLQILILEPEPGLFLRAAELRDFSAMIQSERVGFLFDMPIVFLSGILSGFNTTNIQILKLRSVFERNSEYYDLIDKELRSFIRKKETNLNTLARFGKTWIRNLFRNIEVFNAARDTGFWYNRFNDIPALIIAAGPSLDSILPFLPELQKRCVLICVDTALRAVLSTGTAPDFIVVIDPQYLNTRHLDKLLSAEILSGHSVLVSESSTHPGVFRHCKIPVYFFKSIFPLGKMIESMSGIHSELGAGGSVATTAWDLARKIGCSDIFTAGLDLGFPNQNTHCRTSLSYLYCAMRTSRNTPIESINFRGVRNAEPFPETNNSGSKTITDQRLIIYKWWFEGQISSSGRSGYYNLSEQGIRIEGMPYLNTSTILEYETVRDTIEQIKANLPLNSEPSKMGAEPSLDEIIGRIITECSRIEDVCRRALGILSGINESSEPQLIRDRMKQLSLLDQKISNSPSRELTGFIIQPVLNEIIDKDGSVFENSDKLYRNLLEACEYHRLHAERAIARKA